MNKSPIKLGVVGLIRGLYVVRDAYQSYKNEFSIAAACDKDPETLEAAKRDLTAIGSLDTVFYESYDEMLKSDIDAVFVATDVPTHVELTLKALEAGKHVLSEIPAFTSIEEAKRLKAAVEGHPELKYMVAENCCYWAFIQAWKKMHEDGKFGEITYAESEYLHAVEPEKIQPYKDENYWRRHLNCINYLTHNLGPLLYIMNDRCTSVSCLASDIKYNPYKLGHEVEAAIFKTEKGAVIRILIAFGAYVGADHNFALLGTRGMIETDKTKKYNVAHSFARLSEIPGTFDGDMIDIPITSAFRGESTAGHGGADSKMMHAFIKCIQDDTEPQLDINFAIDISLPGIMAEDSARAGGAAVEIPRI